MSLTLPRSGRSGPYAVMAVDALGQRVHVGSIQLAPEMVAQLRGNVTFVLGGAYVKDTAGLLYVTVMPQPATEDRSIEATGHSDSHDVTPL